MRLARGEWRVACGDLRLATHTLRLATQSQSASRTYRARVARGMAESGAKPHRPRTLEQVSLKMRDLYGVLARALTSPRQASKKLRVTTNASREDKVVISDLLVRAPPVALLPSRAAPPRVPPRARQDEIVFLRGLNPALMSWPVPSDRDAFFFLKEPDNVLHGRSIAHDRPCNIRCGGGWRPRRTQSELARRERRRAGGVLSRRVILGVLLCADDTRRRIRFRVGSPPTPYPSTVAEEVVRVEPPPRKRTRSAPR